MMIPIRRNDARRQQMGACTAATAPMRMMAIMEPILVTLLGVVVPLALVSTAVVSQAMFGKKIQADVGIRQTLVILVIVA
jgi:fumarate reductase subunit D